MKVIPLFVAILTQAPVYVVWLVGIILAIINWKKHPSMSLLALIAFVCLFVLALIVQIISVYHGVNLARPGLAFIEALIRAALWGLVVAAMFGWRK